MASLNDIRTAFLDFFRSKGHQIMASSPLVPQNDPTLMFTNAGMVQFKNVFTGAQTPPEPPRAVTSQKCVRAGGKHNDLDNVGYTARHHTFFEMLGNFSFGDYFKAEAISHAWELLTRVFGIDAAKLIVTVYHTDEEARGLWRKIAGLSDDRIISIPTNDNFWSMGDTGPCGPCSEIFYDHGEHIWGGVPGSAEEDGDRWIEIWNLVFMQFERHADGSQTSLPKPSIDTGMGLERVSAVLQGVHDNYDIDLFRTLIAASESLTGVKAEGDQRASHRVIADHIRASSFLIADGVTPSNEGRGYVLRRIMRRAMRHAHMLGASEPLLHRLAPVLIQEMGGAYSELRRAEAFITSTLEQEEVRFRRTLGRGLSLLDEESAALSQGQELSGQAAFQLYDTYGFPVDLTQDVLRARGIGVDMAGFHAAMDEQKALARAAWSGSGAAGTDAVWLSLKDQYGGSEFLGYGQDEASGQVLAIVVDGAEIGELSAGQEGELVFNQTPFYAESGGQAGDKGKIQFDTGAIFEVYDTQKRAGTIHGHKGRLIQGHIKVGDAASLTIDLDRRTAIRANHSATHLLHAALQNVLGPHVTQKGSLVEAERLRFDFAHGCGLTRSEIDAIEAEVNAVIRQNTKATTRLMTPDEAIEEGAMALFGEKYGDEVRVLAMGRKLNQTPKSYSVELCGGTHVSRTGDIGSFVIVSEGAVAAGVRRIEAATGQAALDHLKGEAAIARAAAEPLKAQLPDLPARIEALMGERKRLEKELTDAKQKLALGGSGDGAKAVEEINGIKLDARILDGIGAKDLRPMVNEAIQKLGQGVVAYIACADGKAAIAVASTIASVSAVDLVKAGVFAMGGQGGGGRPDFAQGGAPTDAQAAAGLEAVMQAMA
ncbi:alanine--tRNA ligase [Candidatus Phycosocius spiralis]|uniref:Alanine--tRNA ligase n=1 Tax=Candidatus Phycosocius spiralis TaxID=2815099 RepID=A0ABQ4PWM5_9PROT|nr:alanine--tRNA ligase [Candidatus Phycosocius spiralis]GIU67351.1 alanine--tRNA ligase [Candidatus Phycosocius spiralis]